MNPNLRPRTTLGTGYKHIILRKLSYAVTCSVISQLAILFWYIFILNFSIFSPLNSISDYLDTLTSVGTWVYILLFSTVEFAQSIICAKDYIITPRYCSNRFSKLKAIFSLHNLILLNLHIFVGFVNVCLFLAFTSFAFVGYKTNRYLILENTLYLLYLGAWIGFYYFISVYTSEKKVLFPVIQQLKWLQFKAHLFPMIRRSSFAAFWPTVYFVIVYAMCGRWFNEILPLDIQHEGGDFGVYLFAWFFAALIYFSLNLMNFYYELFLTEPLAFPIESSPVGDVTFTLREALETQVPIIQHLACQDVYFLAGNSRERRQVLFTLSNPGNHPHNWNQIIQAILNIVKTYTSCLNNSLNNIISPTTIDKTKIDEQLLKHTENHSKTKLRQMGILLTPERINVLSLNTNKLQAAKNDLVDSMTKKIDGFILTLKERLGINFMFQELPEANIQKCLGEGQVIVWLVQALSCLCSTSIGEDRYGIAQKDLPAIISALVELKVSIEKLNRLPTLSRKSHGADDFNCKMKWAILSALRRGIYNIVNNFGPYLRDLNLRADVVLQLQGFAVKNGY